MIDKQRLVIHKAFQQLPLRVIEWLASEEVTYIIIDMNRRLGLEGVFTEVIPHLITRMAVKDLDPKKFINELSNSADLEWPIAQVAVEEIERRILRPVEISLRNEAGVDIKAIFLARPPTPSTGAPTVPTRPIIQMSSPTLPVTPPTISSVPVPPKTTGIPVKINVQPARPAQDENPPMDEPFGSDSWVNKVK